MQGSNGPGRRGAWGVVVIVLLLGIHLVRDGTAEYRAGGPPQPLAAAAPGRAAAVTPAKAPAPLPASRPERLRVPAARIDAPVTSVGLDAEGWIDTPPAYERNLVGWYTGAVTPGEQGTAVLVGHVDTPEGRAVFFGLGALAHGRRIEIARADGRTAVFSVYGVETVPQQGFPAARIYRNSGLPELRLITCGGEFSEGRGYDGNVVVSARLVAVS
ncbi:class F sortase [Streptomyces sp. NPDC053755]|uniref:class F sortase n=1 Tax=Streptomyces sp. NPDC053755 TaxID=3155815 RepID=UPI00342B1091